MTPTFDGVDGKKHIVSGMDVTTTRDGAPCFLVVSLCDVAEQTVVRHVTFSPSVDARDESFCTECQSRGAS